MHIKDQAIEVSVQEDEPRTLQTFLKLHRPKNRRSDDEKRRILGLVGTEPGMSITAVAWINRIPLNYLYRWQRQLQANEVPETAQLESASAPEASDDEKTSY
jgi:transposase-like protein